MRKLIKIIVLAILIFISVTWLTMEIETPFDGNDTYGWPFTFYTRLSVMTEPSSGGQVETSTEYFLIDFVVSGVLAFVSFSLVQKLIRRNK